MLHQHGESAPPLRGEQPAVGNLTADLPAEMESADAGGTVGLLSHLHRSAERLFYLGLEPGNDALVDIAGGDHEEENGGDKREPDKSQDQFTFKLGPAAASAGHEDTGEGANNQVEQENEQKDDEVGDAEDQEPIADRGSAGSLLEVTFHPGQVDNQPGRNEEHQRFDGPLAKIL